MTSANRVYQKRSQRVSRPVKSDEGARGSENGGASAPGAAPGGFGHSYTRLVAATRAQSDGAPVQRAGGDEEELQMKADPTVQRAGGEEEELQMKADPTVQREPEEEEPLQMKADPTVQREPEEEEPLQMKADPTAQREPEEEEPLQMKADPATQRKSDGGTQPNNTGLPDNVKSGIENRSGMSLDSVKVHYNSSKPAQIQALAYTQGTDIHVGPGQEQHVPHEAWHVVQQAQGRVKPTMSLKGVNINDDAGLEHEADMMGRSV